MYHWVTTNWKLVTSIGGMVASALIGGAKYTAAVDAKIDANKAAIVQHTDVVDSDLEGIRRDIGEMRCMLILESAGGDPLQCIQLSGVDRSAALW